MVAVTGLTVAGASSGPGHLTLPRLSQLYSQPAAAQTGVRIQDAWQQVYKQLPNLPLENQYINKEAGAVDPNNTLVSRLIRYHVYTKGRPPQYRLDWKLTLADYLDANTIMQEGVYPGYEVLTQNPMEGDRAAIRKLNRAERDQLVQALVNIFTPQSRSTNRSNQQPTRQPNTSRPGPTRLPQSRPGDAQLLMP